MFGNSVTAVAQGDGDKSFYHNACPGVCLGVFRRIGRKENGKIDIFFCPA